MADIKVEIINKLLKRINTEETTIFQLIAPSNSALDVKKSWFGDTFDVSAEANEIKSATDYSIGLIFGNPKSDRTATVVRNGKDITVTVDGITLTSGEVLPNNNSLGCIIRVMYADNKSIYDIIILSQTTILGDTLIGMGPIKLLQFYQSEIASSPSESLIGLSNKSDCPMIFIQATTDYFSGLNILC